MALSGLVEERCLLVQKPIAGTYKEARGESAEITSLPAKILQCEFPITLNVGRDFGLERVLDANLPAMIQCPTGYVDIVCGVHNFVVHNFMRE